MPTRAAKSKRGNAAAATRSRATRGAPPSRTPSARDSSSLSSAKSTASVDQIGNAAIEAEQEAAEKEEHEGDGSQEEGEDEVDVIMDEAAEAEPMTINPLAFLGQPAPTDRSKAAQNVDDGDDVDEAEEDEGDEEEIDEEEDDDEGDDEEEADDDEEEADGDEDEEEDEDEAADDDEDEGQSSTYRYPASVPDFAILPDREKRFKLARYFPCTMPNCKCCGLVPPSGSEVELQPRDQINPNEDVDMNGDDDERTPEGWWRECGECRHGWEDGGHVLPHGLDQTEKLRRGKVVGRIEELLQDRKLLTTFPTPRPSSLSSLFKQLEQFQRPAGGKKPVAPLPAAVDMTEAGTPITSREDGTPADSDEERPPKRSRRSDHDDVEGESEGDAAKSPGTAGRKKSGKTTAGKGTKPRTVVRGTRGLVPMETDADGNLHVGGNLPDSAIANGEAVEVAADEEEVPLAKRPELDEGERRRREIIKEKAKERENKVLRRLNKEADGGEESAVDEDVQEKVDVEVWEGVEITKLPLRDAAVEESKNEIMLTVVSSRNPTPISSILLIGLKNLFQRQLPKMPREYITRLVLDKNHISMAIVKRGWKVVGGLCYRPFESRGFAEIVFCAIDSSEQIKGYGSHLMNSLKDHVRASHPTISHFLTYADNYAVGYFKKQGFSKEINFDRERWVGYIKDYEGGTIMHCHMLPKVKYLDVHQMLADQKAAVLAKIRTISKSHVIHPGLKRFKDRKAGHEIRLAKENIPGLAESGWNPDLDAIIRQPRRNHNHVYLQLVLDDMQNETSAWPFVKPVDGTLVADYYEVIKEPMDLSTMEYKLENNHYSGIDDFIHDAQLIFQNCRQYNGDKSIYAVQANRLEKAMERIMKARKSSAKA